MAKHETDMHRRLREAQDEIKRLHGVCRSLEQENGRMKRWIELVLFRNPPAGQFEIGAHLRDRREGE